MSQIHKILTRLFSRLRRRTVKTLSHQEDTQPPPYRETESVEVILKLFIQEIQKINMKRIKKMLPMKQTKNIIKELPKITHGIE